MLMIYVLSAFVLGAVFFDVASHRLPNFYLLFGLVVGLVFQVSAVGFSGFWIGGVGALVGLAVFIPFYAMGGMAAGDVKLMAVVGVFLDFYGVLWVAAYSLISGMVFGIFYLIYKGHFMKFVVRYWAMATLRTHIPAEDGDAARNRFPYAIAIAAGTLLSLYWTPI